MSTLLFFWKQRTTLEKLFLVIIAVGLVYGSVVTIQKGIYKYKYFKEVEQQYNATKDSLTVTRERVKVLLDSLDHKTKSIQKRATTINNNLKKNEAAIDNRNYSDDELDSWLTSYDD